MRDVIVAVVTVGFFLGVTIADWRLTNKWHREKEEAVRINNLRAAAVFAKMKDGWVTADTDRRVIPMWIFSKTGFVSIVQHRADSSMMLVRARAAEDIEDMFAEWMAPLDDTTRRQLHSIIDHDWDGVEVACDRSADYWYRAAVPRALVRLVVARQVDALDYDTNFKGNCDKGDTIRHRAYMACWSALNRFQTTYDRTHPMWDEA